MKDEVFAVGYRRLEGGRGAWPPWAIARTLLTLAWRRRATKVVLLACLGVIAFHGVWIVLQMLSRRIGGPLDGNVSLDMIVGRTQEVLSRFLTSQFYVSAIAVAVIGGGAIADDHHAGAFELYFSRPLTRAQYAIGKLLGVGLVPTATILIPVLLLWMTAIGIAPAGYRAELWPMVLPALLGGLVATTVLTATLVGLSAIGQKSRTVGVVYVTGLVVLASVAEGLVASGYTWVGYLSPERDLHSVVQALLDVDRGSLGGQFVPYRIRTANESVVASLLALAGFVGFGYGLLWARIKQAVSG